MKRFIVMALILGSIGHSIASGTTQTIGKHHLAIEKALGE